MVDGIAKAELQPRGHIAAVCARLVAEEGFINALPGLIIEGSPATRVPIVLERLKKIAAMRMGS